jgi:hypothetical protein
MSVSLLQLKTYFRQESPTRTELLQMSVPIKNTTKCVMHLEDSAWFLPLWNAMTDAEKLEFRKFIGTELLHLTVPAYFCVHVREQSTHVVIFYVYNDLQALVDAKGSPFNASQQQDRMEDAMEALHNPSAFQHSLFLRTALGQAVSCPGISVAAQLARLHAFSI